MRLDHVLYAAGPEGLDSTAEKLADELGVAQVDGGVHPRFGVRYRTLPLVGGHYVEVVEALDHPVADKVPFGQAVRARSITGGWLGWVVEVADLVPVQERLGATPVQGNRKRPDGFELLWKQIGIHGLMNDPQLPCFVRWESDPAEHPSKGGGGAEMLSLQIAGNPSRVSAWLGGPANHPVNDVDVTWAEVEGVSGVVSVTFRTDHGLVRL